jgi:hypothetical protein
MFIITQGTYVYRRIIHSIEYRINCLRVQEDNRLITGTASLPKSLPAPFGHTRCYSYLLTRMSHTNLFIVLIDSIGRYPETTSHQDFSDAEIHLHSSQRGRAGRYAYLSKQRPSARIPNFSLPSVRRLAHFHPIHSLCYTDQPYSPNSHTRVLTTATSSHVMTSTTDLESGQGGAQDAPHTGVFCSLFHRCPLGSV